MHLRKFEIRNFKGIEQESVNWDDYLVLIGANNAGKSTVLQALQCYLGGSAIKDDALCRDDSHGEENAIELIGYFDRLTDAEKNCVAIRGRMFNDEWVLKKKFWREKSSKDGSDQTKWQEMYFSYAEIETFKDWPEKDTSWDAFPDLYKDIIEVVKDDHKRVNNEARELLKKLIKERKSELVQKSEPQWIPNPGGGGSWKANANSVIPRYVYVEAVHDATSEATSKEASSYGKLINLILEKKIMKRKEVEELKQQIEKVLKLFSSEAGPEGQAEEIRELQGKVNEKLNDIIGGTAVIKTVPPNLTSLLLPSTTLYIKDHSDGKETPVDHQGHGLQRSLIMGLLQILAEFQSSNEDDKEDGVIQVRSTIFAIEEPELYMHPQMERKLRDALHRIAAQSNMQVICTTHSPVFLHMAENHKSIVRVVKDSTRKVTFFQVTEDIFSGADEERNRLRLLTCFNPHVNEAFFADRVVLVEELTAAVAFPYAAELSGLFSRHSELRHGVLFVDCGGKSNIPLFQKVLNHFKVPYIAVYDEDQGNPASGSISKNIINLAPNGHNENRCYAISPKDVEYLLGYTATSGNKPYQALQKVTELHAGPGLPNEFLKALNNVYFGRDVE